MQVIKHVGEKVLQQKAEIVKDIALKQELIQDMIRIMRENEGVGIAAPQVGISERVVVIEINKNERYPDAPSFPLTVMINPEVKYLTNEVEEGYEGCLSVPGIRGIVPRYKRVSVKYLDEFGSPKEGTFEDFPAKVVQHEVDHLEGIVFIERVKDLKTLITNENYFKFILGK